MLQTPHVLYVPLLVALTLAIPLAVFGGAQPPAEPEHTKDSLETIKKNLAEKKALLIDVREQKEWNEGRLQQALLVPLSKLRDEKERAAATKALDKKQIIYCHCRAGGRALVAAEILRQQGYDVRPLRHGYEELVEAGFPTAPTPVK